eukprot:6425199-Pyramimonas_sp.AAC.1
MLDCIIHEFKCQIASKTSQVLASHQALQDQLRTKLGPLAGPNSDRSGPNLGVETGAGRPPEKLGKASNSYGASRQDA